MDASLITKVIYGCLLKFQFFINLNVKISISGSPVGLRVLFFGILFFRKAEDAALVLSVRVAQSSHVSKSAVSITMPGDHAIPVTLLILEFLIAIF